MAYSAALIVQKSVVTRVSPFGITWLGCAAATVVLLPFAPSHTRDIAAGGATAIGWIVYLGIAPTAIGFVTWPSRCSGRAPAAWAPCCTWSPRIAVLLGWALLGEAPPWLAVAGGALCLAGVGLARRG